LAVALVANMSNIVYPATVLANLYLNNRYLPKEIRPSPLITIALIPRVHLLANLLRALPKKPHRIA